MNNRLTQMIRTHAFLIMIVGMMVAIVGVSLLMAIRLNKLDLPRYYALFIGIGGLVIYVIGRIAHFINNKDLKNLPDKKEL